MRGRQARGFTLVELIIALAIVGALLAVAFGGLRVAIAAWNQGEDRAESHAHLRGIGVMLGRAVGGAYPYRGSTGDTPDFAVLFSGSDERLELVTQSTPFPFAIPVAFTAVALTVETDDSGARALVVRQRALPNRNPFSDARIVLRDPAVQNVKFSYLDAGGGWVDRWDGDSEKVLPRAIRITLGASRNGRPETVAPITVALRSVSVPQQ